MELIRDKHGRLSGVIREIAGGRKRLYTPQGEAIADYFPLRALGMTPAVDKLAAGDRLAGLVDDLD